MADNSGAQDASGPVRADNVSGMMIVGSGNTVNHLALNLNAEYGSTVTVHAGPLPAPVKRQPISQLPRSAADPLIGRDEDLRVLQEAVRAGKLVQIWGASGIGKSVLLRHLARTLPRGADGVAYIEAGGRTADDIAQAIFDISFDAPNYKPSPEVLKEHLKQLRLRIYLDDTGLDGTDLRRLLDLAQHSTFVFTSQQLSAVDGVQAVQLKGLTAPAAAKLVATLLGRELRTDEASTVDALCDVVDGSPLQLRRIASSAAGGAGLPGVTQLPELIPALVRRLEPREHDLMHLLGSLSGAELAARHLNDLLGHPDSDAVADSLVRRGLLLASETGYSCPPDVAEYVLTSRGTEFPADRLCRELTEWVRARGTTPDDVAAHFQALDVAVVRAEQRGHPELGVALVRAASPKLALSRQFDAWGCLLGAGWSAARSAEDTQGEEFFVREADTRKRAIGRAALKAGLVVEAGVLVHELLALRAHSAVQQVAHTASTVAHPASAIVQGHAAAHTSTAAHTAAHVSNAAHTAVHTSAAAAHLPTAAARPVFDLSQPAQHAQAATHVANAHSTAAQIRPRVDLSHAHTSLSPSSHAATTTTTATGGAHTAATTVAVGAKGGMSALAVACTFGFVAVLGVGVTAYENHRPDPSPVAAPTVVDTLDQEYVGTQDPAYDTPDSVDPVCATLISDLPPGIGQFSADASSASDAMASYNSAMDDYNAGQAYAPPDPSTVFSQVSTVINDLSAIDSTLQEAMAQAQDDSLKTDLDSMLTPVQQMESLYQSYADSPSGTDFDTSSQGVAMLSAADSLDTDCGE
ncbi:ATP-binding protein [Streptomyces sp. NRRL F-5123]|uniref:ATP-binding protein n=1 Tax=Streptomyces sp. NRRL F-5123 TaxID=1463856 RepID=UPI00131E7E11|nr:ATP-binding protein [Streptomyces sp. NRRL F-5123]